MTNEVLKLDDLKATNLPELQGFKETQEALVKQYPFIEITDNASYENAKKHRTTLLKGRTSLEAQDKLIASKLSNFRKDVKTIIDDLVAITLPHEVKQQEEVKRFEEIKENERIEKERVEELRIKTIKDKIDAIETECLEVIQKMTFVNILADSDKIAKIYGVDFDFEEYDILLIEVQKRISFALENKIQDLTEKENTRVENKKLQKEKDLADAKLKAIEEQQDKEKKERYAKELEQKNQQFEVRKNRLYEIGLVLSVMDVFVYPDSGAELNNFTNYEKETIFNCDVIDFENYLNDAKNSIQEAIELRAKQQSEKEVSDKLEKEKQAKSDKENKARIKRLAPDKKIISESLEVYFADLDLFTENQETKDFIESANKSIQSLKIQLLTELENL